MEGCEPDRKCNVREDSKTIDAVGEPLKGHFDMISCIAFSPDSSQLVSSAWDGNIFVTTIKDAEQDTWKQSCRAMNAATNGWIKNGEQLLFWVPPDYRHWFRGNVDVWIRDGLREWERVPPKVDLDLLDQLSGERWTDVYVGTE